MASRAPPRRERMYTTLRVCVYCKSGRIYDYYTQRLRAEHASCDGVQVPAGLHDQQLCRTFEDVWVALLSYPRKRYSDTCRHRDDTSYIPCAVFVCVRTRACVSMVECEHAHTNMHTNMNTRTHTGEQTSSLATLTLRLTPCKISTRSIPGSIHHQHAIAIH